MKRTICVFVCYLCCQCALSFAATVKTVQVSVGKVSEIVLPEKVAKVIKGGAVDSVLIEVLEKSVYVLPKSNTPADIFITGVSGESYPINFLVGLEHDLRVDLKGNTTSSSGFSNSIKPLELMTMVLRGLEPAGATVLKTSQRINLEHSPIQVSVDLIYDFPQIAAYVLTAQNTDSNSVVVPVEQISFSNILAISSQQDLLMPAGKEGDSTKIYMIVGKQG